MLLIERYFYKRIALLFGFILCSMAAIYTLVDYSSRFKLFYQATVNWQVVLFYFLARLGSLAELLLPLAFAIAFVATLGNSMMRNEILALWTSGISTRRIMRPFMISASVVAALLYLHFQFGHPTLKAFEQRFFERTAKIAPSKELFSLTLSDQSHLLYQNFDSTSGLFFDVIWIKNLDEIYRMEKLKTIDASTMRYEGINVEKYARTSLNTALSTSRDAPLRQVEKLPSLCIEHLPLSLEIQKQAIPLDSLSLTALFGQLSAPYGLRRESAQADTVATLLLYRLLTPLTPLLAILVLTPPSIRVQRKSSLVLIMLMALILLFTCFTITRASLILGKKQVVAPMWAMALPFLIAFGISGKRYGTL